MIQKQLRQKSQILTVDRIFVAINLKNSHFTFLIPIDLISWRMVKRTVLAVASELYFDCEEAQTKITDIEAVQVMIVDGIGTKVPCLGRISTELNPKDGLELSNFLVCQQFGIVHSEMRVVVGVHVGIAFFSWRVFDPLVGLTNPGKRNPVIVALIQVLEVDVVAIGILILGFGGIIIYNKTYKQKE